MRVPDRPRILSQVCHLHSPVYFPAMYRLCVVMYRRTWNAGHRGGTPPLATPLPLQVAKRREQCCAANCEQCCAAPIEQCCAAPSEQCCPAPSEQCCQQGCSTINTVTTC